jgi:hypothetical protein
VAALPPDAYERVIAEPALLSFQHALGQDSSETSENEKDFIMAMIKSWEEGRAEARAEARVETQANAVLTVLRSRGIAVSEADRQRILAQRDSAQLQRWLEKVAIVSSVAEVLDDPS